MKRRSAFKTIILSVLLALVGLTAQPIQPAQAATYPCSEAGLDAAILAGGGPHDFGAGACTITITGTKTINGPLILDGTGGGGTLTISGGGIHQIFIVGGSGRLTLNNLTLRDGRSITDGGAIYNGGSLTISNSLITNNQTSDRGGGIFGGGTINITDNSIISGNTVTNGSGGGIYCSACILDVVSSTITGNFANGSAAGGGGGGVYFLGGVGGIPDTIAFEDSTISNNRATNGSGGGILFHGSGLGQVRIRRTTISGNTAGTYGGGLANISHWGNGVFVEWSTISGNTASNGGGIGIAPGAGEWAYVEVINSTISGNTATAHGGGIYNHNQGTVGQAALNYVTVYNNGAENLYQETAGSPIELAHTIVGGASSGDNCAGGAGPAITNNGNNLEEDTGASYTCGSFAYQTTNAQLGPLANNGGSTLTHLPAATSPAVNRIAVCGIADDQRGTTRPQGASCDVGAVEAELYPEIDVQRPAGTSIADGNTDNVGTMLVGATSLTYTIENPGGADLTIPAGGITASNFTNVSGFSVATALPLTITAGNSTTLQLDFTINAVGAFSFDLDIASNDADENPYDIAVTGTGALPAPEIDVQRPASIADGGNDPVGAQPVGPMTLTYTIDNTAGTGTLTIPAGGVTATNLTNVSGFTVNTGLPLTVAAGTTGSLQIQFNIDAAGAFGFDMDIDSNDVDENPYDIAVSGTGTINLAAAAACNGNDLDVNITAGDNPFDITGTSGPNLPQNGVGMGITTLTGPGSWTGVTVTETVGDLENANLGNYTCPPPAPPPSGGGGGAAQIQAAPGCNATIDVEADREVVNWGDQVVWTVLVTNPGPDDCQGVQTYGTMPGEFSITDIQPSRGSLTWDGGQYYLVELGTLAVSDQVIVTLDSLLQGGAGFVLPEGAAGQSAGQQICLTGYITDPVNDTDCVMLFPDTLPATGGEPVSQPRNWGWVAAAGMLIIGLGGYVVRRRLA